ncbi:MAG TPA: hypothetical protein VHF87_13475 [Methylomirabilota bacterium]|nr:hypothetical protein [Methylomirabilota bacterium]
MSNFLFLLRTYAEVDHIAPLIWKCLEKGDRALVVLHHSLGSRDDFRMRFLATYPGFRRLSIPGAGSTQPVLRLAGRLFWSRARARALLERHRISACFVGSGSGLGPRSRRPTPREVEQGRMARVYVPGRRDLTRLLGRALRPFSASVLLAARQSAIPTFCLPSGIGTRVQRDFRRRRLDVMRQAARGRVPPDWRSQYTLYVYASELQRRREIEDDGLDPRSAEAWGSLRFCPQWLAVQDRILGDAGWPAPALEPRTGVLFLVPKWGRFVDRAATEALLLGLAARRDIRLVLKPHPTKGGLGEELARKLRPHPTVTLAGDTHSSVLVRATDVTVVESSSVAIEALMRGKHLIYASYLHSVPEDFDEHGGCSIAHAPADVHRALDMIARGIPPPVDADARARLLRMLVYGGREPFDIPEHYYGRIQRYIGAAGSGP